MNPKEKALEIIREMLIIVEEEGNTDCRRKLQIAKRCALAAVNQILDLSQIASFRRDNVYMEMEYWGEVINEIEKL